MKDSEKTIIVAYLDVRDIKKTDLVDYVKSQADVIAGMFDDSVKVIVSPTYKEREHILDVYRPKENEEISFDDIENNIKSALEDLKK